MLTKEQLTILDQVRFAASSARLDRRTNALLDNIALVLTAHPEIVKVRVEGHTDDQGPDAKNLKLSQARAEAVVAYLVEKGVAAERLEASGTVRPSRSSRARRGRRARRTGASSSTSARSDRGTGARAAPRRTAHVAPALGLGPRFRRVAPGARGPVLAMDGWP